MIHEPISLEEVQAAHRRLSGRALRTPLVRLNLDNAPAEIYLKLENLQPIGSFKIRGALNVLDQMSSDELADGVWTASAGNMAQGLAWCALEKGIPCSVVVPDTAPDAKLSSIRRLGASIVTVSLEEFFEILSSRQREGMTGAFVHVFSDRRMMAGNGTIALEILEDLQAFARFRQVGTSERVVLQYQALKKLRPLAPWPPRNQAAAGAHEKCRDLLVKSAEVRRRIS